MNIPGATHVGGLIGTGLYYYGAETAFAVTNCRLSGSIDGAVTLGAVAGRAEGSVVESCAFNVLFDGAKMENAIGKTTCMYECVNQ